MDTLKLFGAEIKRRRLELGISQEELASLCDLHRTYVGSVERGERNISLCNIISISNALKCKPSVLLKCFDEVFP
jgi:transcriptional regulator with XRE-family HTH domain